MVKSGIYKITNEITGKFYIGSSIDIDQRFLDHKRDLNNKTHVNIILQRSWDKHGEKAFSNTTLEGEFIKYEIMELGTGFFKKFGPKNFKKAKMVTAKINYNNIKWLSNFILKS